MSTNIKDYKIMSKNEIISYKKQDNCKDITPWVENLGQWNWIASENQLVFNEIKATNLRFKLDEISDNVGFEFFTSLLYPDDYESVMSNMQSHLLNKSETFEVKYRIDIKMEATAGTMTVALLLA